MVKIDLHTHSIVSKDGGITTKQYAALLINGILNAVAVTDHNDMSLALSLHQQLGDAVIAGEEIDTGEGEVIGLYLKEFIAPFQGFKETVTQLKKQGGIVLVPHPFDNLRSAVTLADLRQNLKLVDCIEVFNPRVISGSANRKAREFAKKYTLPMVANSDAHSISEIGKTYTEVGESPTGDNMVSLLKNAKLTTKPIAPLHRLSPAVNRLKKTLKG